MPSFWCEYECVVLKDKVRHINIVRVYLSIYPIKCGSAKPKVVRSVQPSGARGKCRNKEKKLFYFISFIIIL